MPSAHHHLFAWHQVLADSQSVGWFLLPTLHSIHSECLVLWQQQGVYQLYESSYALRQLSGLGAGAICWLKNYQFENLAYPRKTSALLNYCFTSTINSLSEMRLAQFILFQARDLFAPSSND